MLTRLYINNFRCFVNFEYRPERKQLILGANGSGKSSCLDALLLVRAFSTGAQNPESSVLLNHLWSQRTRWLTLEQQTFEIDAALASQSYSYRLAVMPDGERRTPLVSSESVHVDGKPIFSFTNGQVQLFDDDLQPTVAYPFDKTRSALATIVYQKDNLKLIRFKSWLTALQGFRINPFSMTARAENEAFHPSLNLSNFAAWYRHLIQTLPRVNQGFVQSLSETLDGFTFLQLDAAGEDVRLLAAEFSMAGGGSCSFRFQELSEGQKCLICLYAILHFVVANDFPVVIDEPENFISLREIQPWLTAASEMIDEGKGQLILISHHPEIMNQWAPDFGVNFSREGNGPVRVSRFSGDPESCLSPAELIARGWEGE
ncbi:MAG TPA: AAA family ATPase [Bryobacteraceae bacterium]|nr:AAA family ATPase [Bryobacteraceae bacterium]